MNWIINKPKSKENILNLWVFFREHWKIHVLIVAYFLGTAGNIFAQQDIQFSQYVFNGLTLNPAYAGYKETTNLNLSYRNQWTGLVGSPKTVIASIDGMTRTDKIGLGVLIIQDELGAQSNLSVLAEFSYCLRLNSTSGIRLGLASGINQFKVDKTKIFGIEKDLIIEGLAGNVLQPDFQFGLFYASQSYFLGLSATELFANLKVKNPSYFVIYHTRHYYLQAGALWDLNQSIKIKPSILLKEDFLGPTNMDFNLFFLFQERIWLGASYRAAIPLFRNPLLQTDLTNRDAVSVMLEYYVNPNLRIGYSFDYSTSHLGDAFRGSHEISIGYTLSQRKKIILSPRFF